MPPRDDAATPALDVIQSAKLACTRYAESLQLSDEPNTDALVDLATLWRRLDSQSWEIRRRMRKPVRSLEPSWVQKILSSSFK